MPVSINSLSELKKHPIYRSLALNQAENDAKDQSILESPFTRSLNHIIQFLIIYAGLDEAQKIQALSQLSSVTINKAELEELVNTVNWPAVLSSRPNSTMILKLIIELRNPSLFLEKIRQQCISLHEALLQQSCVISIKANNEVVVTTMVSQIELWQEPFLREPGSSRWEVPVFKLGELLTKEIREMNEGEAKIFGAFEVNKGRGSLANTTELYIKAPSDSNRKFIKYKGTVNSGIYNAFVGLKDFYGLDEVLAVKVQLESNATFSDKGASASQAQVITVMNQSFNFSTDPGKPTVITVYDLNVFFKGLDCVATFDKNVKSSNPLGIYDIALPTRSKEKTGILLLSQTPDPYIAAQYCLAERAHAQPKRPAFFGKKKPDKPETKPSKTSCCTLM